MNGHVETVKLLLEAKANVNAARPTGHTPLIMASVEGHTDIVKLLLKANADVNAAERTGSTSLYLASSRP
jgi:ankyrin repeat protein